MTERFRGLPAAGNIEYTSFVLSQFFVFNSTVSVNYQIDLFQARTQQLLQQNRELLEHIAALGGGYHEPDRPNLTATSIGIAPQVIIAERFLVI